MQTRTWAWVAEIHALCRAAGAFQMQHFRQNPPGWGDEKEEKQYVSWVDVESERILRAGLAKLCPDAGFYGEESVPTRNLALEWVVDPLDGTTNYLSGYEQFAISVALVQEGEPYVGVIYRPATDDVFLALRGQGAKHNDRVLPRRAPLPLAQALISTGFPFRSPDLWDNFFACAPAVLHAARDIRRTGSAALDLAYVAAGYLQGFWEADLQPYDVAAGLALLNETGCPYSATHQQPYRLFADRIIILGVPGAYEELCNIVSRYYTNCV